MFNKKWQRLSAWVMTLIIMFGVISPQNEAFAATPATLDAKVTVTGINEGGTIHSSSNIDITVDFNVPVKGDGIDDYYNYGDSVTLPLSTSFKFDSTKSIELMFGFKKMGTVTLRNNSSGQAEAYIVFNGDEDIFDPEKITDGGLPYSNVRGQFQASLKYNGIHDTDSEGNKTVSILEKTYKLQLPGDIITYMVEKTADGSAVNLDDGTITWTVDITATKDTEPVTHIDLEGYVFEDDLKNVGAYADGSFSLTRGTLVVPDSGASSPTTKLTYTFPAGSISPLTLNFKTKISDTVLTNGGSITNGAGLYLDNKSVGFDDFKVTISKPAVTKSGVTNDTVSTSYDPTNRTITWYVDVDPKGRTLNNLKITDELKGGLTLGSAQWQKWNTTESKWEDVPGASWTVVPADNEYKISESVDYVGRLMIVTKVPDATDGSVVMTTYKNQAKASWTGASRDTDASANVDIGYNAITKSGAQIDGDITNHQITWTINVDLKGQPATDFKVYDLFVHDKKTTDTDIAAATNWPSGLAIGSNKITRNNGQKYVAVSSKDSHLTVNAIDLIIDGKTIGTLVEITGLQSSGSNNVVLKSQIIDPDIIAGNDSNQKVPNSASLYQGATYRASANCSVSYNNKILSKELLKRDEVGIDHNTEASINANSRSTNVADGFHYGYKEVIFRLNVNAAGVDFKDVETTLSGDFGDVVVTDTLPAGWEFAKFSGGEDYLIYEADNSLNTTDGPLTSVSGLTAAINTAGTSQTATFTFTDLDKPYVILVKARPANDTFEGYLKGSDTRDETNTLNLKTANWTTGKSVTQKVTVNSRILHKSLDLSKQNQGILTWTVNYTPFGHEIGIGMEDTLPQGIDIRTDSSGQLIWGLDGSRNITVHTLTLRNDGSGAYDVDIPELTIDELKSAVSYDSSSRKLTFNFPTKGQAYRLTYVTDITGMPGSVTNEVKLLDAAGSGTSANQSFSISEQHGLATMSRSGYLVIKKQNMDSNPLSGADFTLYNTNADGSKASSRAVRNSDSNGLAKFYGLTPGNYILVETKASSSDYENPATEYSVVVSDDLKVSVNGSSVITSSNPFIVTNYKSTDPVGSLTIRKTVAGNMGDTSKAFAFTLTLDGATGTYAYVGQGVPGGNIASGDAISLAHGQSITVTGLPTGTTYTVIEENYSDDGYATVSTGATGVIETNTTHTAVFTNTKNVYPPAPDNRTGTLTISKTVTGTGADTAKEFLFTVTFTGASETYHYTGNGVPSGTMKSGDTIALSNEQSITITGLPVNSEYHVTEDAVVAKGYSIESEGSSGTISSSHNMTAAFTNTKLPETTGSLTISKTVTGQDDISKKFDFIVSFTDAPDAYPYTGTYSGTLRSGDIIPLASGESITITDLPDGAKYTVTEADYTGQGYTATSMGAAGVISAGTTQTASFVNKWNKSPDKPGTPEDPYDEFGDGEIPRGSKEGENSGMPKTGDNQTGDLAKLGILFFSLALGALFTADCILRKRSAEKRNRK